MPLSKKNLLIVEDDPDVRTTLSQVFTSMGYGVQTAEDGLSAIAAMREQVPDVLLSDLNMSGMSGFELLSVVSRRFPHVRAIAMSGAFSETTMRDEVSADAYYEKGSGLDALLRAIEAPLSPKRMHRVSDPTLGRQSGQNVLPEELIMMACPECLRTFPQAISGTASMILDTSCIYCGGLFVCTTVEPTEPIVAERLCD